MTEYTVYYKSKKQNLLLNDNINYSNNKCANSLLNVNILLDYSYGFFKCQI